MTASASRKEHTLSAALWRRPWARATLLLTPPLAWFVLLYLAALVVLLITAFWQINPFTTNIERVFSFSNLDQIFTSGAYRAIIVRTVGMAAAVTVTDAIVAFPFAYFMARIASPRARTALFVAILLPLWASYLAKVYSWLLIFTHNGFLDWGLGKLGIGQVHLIYTAVAYALHQFRFFGREAISFMLVLPGIITGIALNSFLSFTGVQFGTLTIVIGHTTFCIVVVFNNLIARLRRTPGSLAEASMDLGARGWQTLRFVTLPLTATALVSGALLAFGLSFDEVIVTVFTAGAQNTLPLWIFGAIRLGQQLPEVNAVVSIVILLTIIPVVLAARLAGAGAVTRSARNVPVN